MKRTFIINICLGIILAIISGCSMADKVTYTQSGSMVGLKKYAWMTDSPQIRGEIRTDKWSLDSEIRQEINDGLAAKGYVKITEGKPDFYINYKLSIVTQENVLFDNDVNPAVETLDKGSLIIEAVDPGSKTAIWQGEQKAKVYRYDFVDTRIRFVENSIREILSEFP